MLLRAVLALFALAALVLPARAGAQDGSMEPSAPVAGDPLEVEEARRHYAQGVVFFRGERFEEAIAEFEEAYARWPNPTILYSLGQSYERLLRVPRAIDAYRRFLASATPDDPRRASVEDTIRGLETILATIVVESNVPATVWANGEQLGTAPGRVALATGRYDLEIRADGFRPHRETLMLAARTERVMRVVLEPVPEPTLVVGSSGIEPVWFWTSAGVTVVAAIVTGIVGGLTLDASSSYESAAFRTQEMRDEGQRLAITTDLLGGVTALFSITTLVLALLTDWDDEARRSSARAGALGIAF